VDFVEADGAQDMGHTTQLLFADYLETGWWFDPWFAGNAGWFHLNRYEELVGDSLLTFSSTTFPATTSNSGTPSHLRIGNISNNGPTMSFTISSDRLAVTDSISTFLGWGAAPNSLWAFNADSSQIVETIYADGSFTQIPGMSVTAADILLADGDSTFQFRYPWVFPNMDTGTRFIHIESGETHPNAMVSHPFEIVISKSEPLTLSYFAERDNDFVLVKWFENLGQSTIEGPLPGPPVARFQTTSGIQPFYSGFTEDPTPAGVTPYRDPDEVLMDIPEAVDVISWSPGDNALKISHLPTEAVDFIDVDRPLHIIPLDVDLDGYYEIALFYENSVKIINQAGIVHNGNPFSTEPYFGNPIVGATIDGQTSIFLRHLKGYSIFSYAGELLDSGVLPQLFGNIENSLSTTLGLSLILSGQDVLYFEYDGDTEGVAFWADLQGNREGDRTVLTPRVAIEPVSAIQSNSVYNYPNPIKGNTTTVRAWLGDVQEWSIEIFSMNGSQVVYTEQEVLQPNSYNEWVWDASNVSSGVYLAKVVAGNSSEIIKIAVIR